MSDRRMAARPGWSSLVYCRALPSAVRRTPMGRMRCSNAAARKTDSDPPR
jgi:hypothetical protein